MQSESVALVVEYDTVIVQDCDELVGLIFRSIPLVEAAVPQSSDSPTYLLFHSQLLELKRVVEEALGRLDGQEDTPILQ